MYLDVEYFLNKNRSLQVGLFETRDGVCCIYLCVIELGSVGLRQRWARDVKARDRDETETRRLYVTRRHRDVIIGLGLHVIMIAVVTLFSRPYHQ